MNQELSKYIVSLDITIEARSADEAVQQAHIVMQHGTTESAVGYKTYFVNNVENG